MKLWKRHNDLEELEKIIIEFQDAIFNFAFFRTGNQDDARDIVQDVFLKFYQEKENFAQIKNLKSYLFRSVANACKDYKRKESKSKTTSIGDFNNHFEALTDEPFHNSDLELEFIRLEALLLEIPENQQEIIKMKFIDDLSFVEISEILEIPVTTVKSRFKYGIDKLRTKLETNKEVSYEM